MSTRTRDWRQQLSRGFVEFVVIGASVLAALAADGWRDTREDRRSEAGYVSRLLVDLQADTFQLGRGREALLRKQDSLRRLAGLGESAEPVPPRQVAEDIASSGPMTWNFAQANATTFEEMRSIGALALIRDSDLRAEVGRYYARYEDLRATVEARRTRFGPLGYELVRREWPESEEGFGDFRAADLSPEELKGLTSASVQADIRRAATAELNYSAHGAARAFELKRTATDLIARLVEYRGGGS